MSKTIEITVHKITIEEYEYEEKIFFNDGKFICKALYHNGEFVSYNYQAKSDLSYIKDAIANKSQITINYLYSYSDLDRTITPLSIEDNFLLALEEGKYRKFNLDGILLRSEISEDYKELIINLV